MHSLTRDGQKDLDSIMVYKNNYSMANQNLEATFFNGSGNEQADSLADFVREQNGKKVEEIKFVKSDGEKGGVRLQFEAQDGFSFNMNNEGSIALSNVDGTVYVFNGTDASLTVVRRNGQPERYTAVTVDENNGREYRFPPQAGFRLRDFGRGGVSVEPAGSELSAGFNERRCRPYPPPKDYFTTPYFMYTPRRAVQSR